MAPTEASTPPGEADAVPPSSMSATPPAPTTAPARCRAGGRSATSPQATAVMTIGEVAMIVEARLVGSDCAAMYTRAKKTPVLSSPSTALRHHHEPLGSRRRTTRSSSPAGRALIAAPYSGSPAGRQAWVTR